MVRHFVIASSVAAAAIVACQVYDPDDLVGGGKAGAASGGTGVGASGGDAGRGGTATSGSGGTVGDGGTSMNLDAGAGGEDPTGGTAGSGGTTGGTGGNGGTGGGVSGTGGTSGTGGVGGSSGTGGAGGTGGTTAGTGGVTAGTGGAGGAGSGGTDAGGAGTGGTAAGSAGMAGATAVELTGTATASSEENTTSQMHPAIHGNDNDPATRWCAANGNTGQYWQVDLAAVHALTRFEVTWEYPSQAVGLPYLYAIGISDDGTTFTTVIDKTANTDVATTQSSDFPAGTMARHVRITLTGLPQSTMRPTWASFWEASVFGY